MNQVSKMDVLLAALISVGVGEGIDGGCRELPTASVGLGVRRRAEVPVTLLIMSGLGSAPMAASVYQNLTRSGVSEGAGDPIDSVG
jgi:hypothetical protein